MKQNENIKWCNLFTQNISCTQRTIRTDGLNPRAATRDAHAYARIYTPSMNVSSAGRSHENYYARRPHPRE